MEIGEFLLMMGIPTAVTGLLVWWLKRHMDKTEKTRHTREQNIESLMLMIMQTSRANYILSTATAKAVQRIPDAHCNGDMTAALEQAEQIQKEEKEFLMDQSVKHIFGTD